MDLDNQFIGLVISMLVSILLSLTLIHIYKKFSLSSYKRKNFEQNFIIIAPVITLLIFIVKSNLALSLGLVGALSIIRYRTAIKDPEEIAYLFICVAVGVGTGASFNLFTIIAFAIIILVIFLNSKRNKNATQSLGYIIEIESDSIKNKLDNILEFMNSNSTNIIKKLILNNENNYVIVFEIIELKNNKNIIYFNDEIKKIISDAKIHITSVNNDIENI